MSSSSLACTAIALATALPCAARAAEMPSVEGTSAAPYSLRRSYSPRGYDARYGPQARQGALISFGLGGGSLYLSPEGPARVGAGDVDFRVGYGFSD